MSYELCEALGIIRPAANDVFLPASVFQGEVPREKACKIYLKETAVPKSFPARRLLIAVHEPVKAKLDNMVKESTIEPVTEPTEWCCCVVQKNGRGFLSVPFDAPFVGPSLSGTCLTPSLEPISLSN